MYWILMVVRVSFFRCMFVHGQSLACFWTIKVEYLSKKLWKQNIYLFCNVEKYCRFSRLSAVKMPAKAAGAASCLHLTNNGLIRFNIIYHMIVY